MFEDLILTTIKRWGWNPNILVSYLSGKITIWDILFWLIIASFIEFVIDPFKHNKVRVKFLFNPYTPFYPNATKNNVGLYVENLHTEVINNCSAMITEIIERDSQSKRILNVDLMWEEENQFNIDLQPNKPTILLIAEDSLYSKSATIYTHSKINIETNHEYQIGIKFFGSVKERLIKSKEYKFKLIMAGDGVFEIKELHDC